MTRDGQEHVKLARRDWCAIVGIAFAIFTASLASYLRIDRALSGLTIGQTYQGERIGSIERDFARLETMLMGVANE